MLPLQAIVALGVMAIKGYSTLLKAGALLGLSPSDCLVSYTRYTWEESYLSAELHSVYSAATNDWARISEMCKVPLHYLFFLVHF